MHLSSDTGRSFGEKNTLDLKVFPTSVLNMPPCAQKSILSLESGYLKISNTGNEHFILPGSEKFSSCRLCFANGHQSFLYSSTKTIVISKDELDLSLFI